MINKEIKLINWIYTTIRYTKLPYKGKLITLLWNKKLKLLKKKYENK